LDLGLNTLKAFNANDYASYLIDGGDVQTQLVQTRVGGVPNFAARQQSLHDNILGELTNPAIAGRFISLGASDPRTADGLAFGNRPFENGNLDGDAPAGSASHTRAAAWDTIHELTASGGLVEPYHPGTFWNGTIILYHPTASTSSSDTVSFGGFATIQAAINAAANGDTIVIGAGIYREQISIDGKHLTITGAGEGKPSSKRRILAHSSRASMRATAACPIAIRW
jgi:hypothetical protein